MLAREVARRPEPGRDRLHLLGVRGPGDQDDERGQVVVHRPQAVRHPGAEAGPARDLVAGLHVGDRRLVVDRLGVHAPDEAQVVDHPRRVGQHLRDPHAALAVLLELVLRGSDREPLLAARHGREPLAHPDRVGQVLVVPLVHHRLVVVEVHLRRPADHVQVDDVLRLGSEVGQPGQRRRRPRRRRPVPPAGSCRPAARPARPSPRHWSPGRGTGGGSHSGYILGRGSWIAPSDLLVEDFVQVHQLVGQHGPGRQGRDVAAPGRPSTRRRPPARPRPRGAAA